MQFAHALRRRTWLRQGIGMAAALAPAWSVAAPWERPVRQASVVPPAPAGHEGHQLPAPAPGMRALQVKLPGIALVDHRGRTTRLGEALAEDRSVLLQFIYSSCRTVCPTMARTFAAVQDRLGAEAARVHMVSISIDPEYDTPARLAAFARALGAGPQWDFYTGSLDASVAVQRAFDAYRGDKMNHAPAVFLRAAGEAPWWRLDGLVSPAAVVDAYIERVVRCAPPAGDRVTTRS